MAKHPIQGGRGGEGGERVEILLVTACHRDWDISPCNNINNMDHSNTVKHY